uniref:Alpha/beta hydrolase fold-3 domain-containing protein n=1 Tax=Kalanchoe fedtschenkoi TaxID=63787 RepID=A0A7N0T5W8_KALFE
MASLSIHSIQSLQASKSEHQQHTNSSSVVVEEVEGLIRVYKDGRVERHQIVPCVGASHSLPESETNAVTSMDVVVDRGTSIWARVYVPKCQGVVKLGGGHTKLPVLVYFHGGGFCVGSASWVCYHEFLAKLAAKANCLIISVNYRLAPENPLPAAYEDGLKTLMWVKQQAASSVGVSSNELWVRSLNLSKMFLAGDSAGANIAYHVSKMLSPNMLRPLCIKGTILLQPFFGGELRTNSEKYLTQSARSALTLEASDAYWRMALPRGANRDHPWCNPVAHKLSIKSEDMQVATLVCIAEMDIMRDRSMEYCAALGAAGHKVEFAVSKGVGHAFQILNKSQHAQNRTLEMIKQVKNFISR